MDLTQEETLLLKKMVVSREWEVVKDQWAKLMQQKEREKANHLRLGQANDAIRLQGYSDGCNDLIRLIESKVRPAQAGQSYEPY